MKPQSRPSSARWLSHYDRISSGRQPLPPTDWEFQPRRFGNSFGGSDSPRRPDFTTLAREMRADASRRFRLESAVLGLLSLVAAWPIAVMIYEVIRILLNWSLA